LRNFTARDLYVRKDGPVKTEADLVGKRIGMYDWVASGSIWYRHFPITRLFPNFRAVEQDYFRQTGMFPPQHLIVLRRPVWEANKWIAKALTDAFIASNAMFDAAQRGFPYVSPWLEAELEDTASVMGTDFHPDGFEKNRRVIEVFADQAFASGIVGRRISPEEYFSDFLAS
jgi:4,5-dihydroxyphthalate decarboxylase